MNILIYSIKCLPNGGGGERLSHNLARGLSSKDYVFYLSCKVPVPAQYQVNPEPFHTIIQIPDLSKESRKKFVEFIKQNRIDVVINNCADYITDTRFLKKAKEEINFRLISNMLCSPMAYQSSCAYKNILFPKLYIKSWIKQIVHMLYPIDTIRLKEAYNSADQIVFLSAHFIEDFQKVTSIAPSSKKTFVIPNIRTYPNEINLEELSRKEKKVLIVARLYELHKRVSYAIKAWKIIMQNRSDWTLTIVGDGPQKEYYEQMVRKEHIKNIVFAGAGDPLKYYQEASIYIMTSVSEGIPMVLVDSSTYGVVPVVMDTFSSLPDFIENERSGFIVPNNRIDQFAQKIIFLMNNPSIQKDMSLKSINMSKRFSEDIVIDKWDQLLSFKQS